MYIDSWAIADKWPGGKEFGRNCDKEMSAQVSKQTFSQATNSGICLLGIATKRLLLTNYAEAHVIKDLYFKIIKTFKTV